jgi:diguanylate cyclase (GGDEF)-like protein
MSTAHSDRPFRTLVEMCDDFVAIAALDGRIAFVNRAGRAMVGLTGSQSVERFTIEDLLDEDGVRRWNAIERPTVLRDGRWCGKGALRHLATGESVPVAIRSYALAGDDGTPPAFATIQRDTRADERSSIVSEQRFQEERAIAKLASRALAEDIRELCATAVELVCPVLRVDTLGIARIRGDAIEVVVQDSRPGVAHQRRLPPGRRSHVGLTVRLGTTVLVEDYQTETRFDTSLALSEGARSGIAVPIHSREGTWGVLVVHDDEPGRFGRDDVAFLEAVAGVLSQAVSRDDAESALRHLALHDSLTGLPNRALIRDRLEHALAMRRRTSQVTLALFDLNGFKHVNDSFGHAAGDEVLLRCAARLREAAHEDHTVGRLGGDEFVLVCEGESAVAEAEATAQRFMDSCRTAIEIGDERVVVGASCGIAVAGEGLQTVSDLLRAADDAMYVAKRGRIDMVMHEGRPKLSRGNRGRLVFSLRAAIEADRIEVAYQPIWRLGDRRVVAFEALARWQDERLGQVPASTFIPIAEDAGLVSAVGCAVLGEACHAATRARAVVPAITLHVNVSPHELTRDGYVAGVLERLAGAGLSPGMLSLEVTEAVLIEDLVSARAHLSEISARGVRVALDDFGTGYSSLSYLQRLPEISTIKIDKAFVSGLTKNKRDPVVIAIVTMAHALGKTVIAEGVETEEQRRALEALGCDLGQGHLVSRALSEDDLVAFLGSHALSA